MIIIIITDSNNHRHVNIYTYDYDKRLIRLSINFDMTCMYVITKNYHMPNFYCFLKFII